MAIEDLPEDPGESDGYKERDDERVSSPKKESLQYEDDDPNLVFAFNETEEGQAALRKIRTRVLERFHTAWDASEDYRNQVAKIWEMIECILREPKNKDIHPHLPIMLVNITRLAFRTESEIFGDWSRPIAYAPVGETPDDQQAAEARTKHTNFQYREQIPDFQRQVARGLMAFYALGEVIGYSSFDEFCGHNRHEVLTPDRFVMPYVYESVKPDLSDAPWYARVMALYSHELMTKRDDWFGVERVLENKRPSWDDEPEAKLRTAIAVREGQSSESADDAPHKIIHYEGWETELPGQDEPRFIRVYLDERTQAILCLTIHEEERPEELELYQQKLSEMNGYLDARQQHAQAVSQALEVASGATEALKLGFPPDDATMAAAQPPEPPPPPEWMDSPQDGEDEGQWLMRNEPQAPKKYPIYMFSREVNIENVAGNHGIGHGRMQAHYNRNADIALQQFSDAAKASNIPAWLADGRAKVNDGDEVIQFAPGLINYVTLPAGMTLGDALREVKSPPANDQLVNLVGMLDKMGEESAQSPDVLSGEPGKSGETFRGVATRVEQATTQLKVPAGRFGRWIKQLTKNNSRLNAIFLPDEEITRILDPRSRKYDLIKVGRSLYETGAYDVQLTSDMRFISKAERVKEADEVVGMGAAGPLMGNLHFQWHALKGALEARGRYDMVARMGMEPPLPPTPFGMTPQLPPPPGEGSVGGEGGAPPPRTPPQG